MRNSLFNGLTEMCTMVGNMTNIPPVLCMGTPTHYGIYGIYTMPFSFDLWVWGGTMYIILFGSYMLVLE